MDFRRMTRAYWVVWVVVALIGGLAVSGTVSAQTPAGSIVGTVIDQQGLPVEGAQVTLTNTNTNYPYTSVTGSNGGYQFVSIDYGNYSVSVTKDGFRVAVVSNIKLDAATQYTVAPIRLEVGARTESITVEAGPETVNTVNAEVTGTTEKKQIDDLPILDRNPLALLNLQAGVANSGPGGAAETTINGQRSSFSNVTLDGINIQDNFIRENALDFSPNLPFISQTSEFTITEQNGDVDKSGSSSVSLVTPKGTNNWHGEGFWYYRTNSWAANDWFNDASGVGQPRLLQNQGGGNVGGPIRKDKLFIYGWYELLRLRQESVNNATTLSPAIQAGLSSATPTLPFTYQPVDQNTGAPVGNPVTTDLFTIGSGFTLDPTMLALIKRVPITSNNDRVGDGVNLLGYQFNAQSNNSLDNFGFRSDYNLNSKNTISGTFAWNRQLVDRPDIDTSFNKVPLVTNDDKTKFLSLSWRLSPNSSMTNEARFGFNLAPASFLSGQKFSPSGYIDTTTFSGPGNGVPASFTNPDPNFFPQGRNTHTWAALDNFTWVKGNHTMKFGFQFQRVTIAERDSFGIDPGLQIGFSTVATNTPKRGDFSVPAGTQISDADFGDASFLLASAAGILNNVSQTFNVKSQTSGYVPLQPQNSNFRQNNFAFYAGDNWRLTRKLTVNYGLRWDYFSPVDEENGLTLLPVIPSGQTAAQTLVTDATIDFAGGPSKRKLYNSYWKGFSPNIGVAWDPQGNGKTAVRAGFSMNWVNDSFFTAAQNAITGNAGLSTTNTADPNGLDGTFTVSSPAAVTTPQFLKPPFHFSDNAAILGVPNNVGYAIDPNLRPPYVEQWNFSIQRDLGAGTSLTVGYVGNHGVGLFRAVDVNQVNIGSNGFLADFNRARSNGFIAAATPANAPGCTGPGTATQCGQFNPLFNPNLAGSQQLTIFPDICGAGALGFIGPTDFSGLDFLNNNILTGFIGDMAHTYQEFGCGPTPGFFAPNDLIVGGDLLKNSSFSTYHAGTVEVRRRFNKGLYFQANYVFSKVMTDYGTSVNADQSRFQPYLDNARPFVEKARAPFDLTHQFKANFTYELPIGKGQRFLSTNSRAWGLLLNGWQTGSIFTWQSGAPFSIVSTQPTFNRSGTRSLHNTAVATLTHQQISGDLGVFVQPGGIVYLINPKLVNPATGTGAPSSPQLSCAPAVPGGFCNPQPGEIGNLQLNAFNGPSYFAWNFSATKRFELTERIKLSFRTEAFNVLNHPVFAPPVDANFNSVMNINDQTFGQSLRTVTSPRILQMSLRLQF